MFHFLPKCNKPPQFDASPYYQQYWSSISAHPYFYSPTSLAIMQLFVLGESLRCLEVEEGTTVAQLRRNLGEEGVLTHCGLPLEEGDCVSDLPALTTLHLAPRLLGG